MTRTLKGLVQCATVAIVLVAAGCDRSAQVKTLGCEDRYTEADRLRAMVVVQAMAQAWDAEGLLHDTTALQPSQSDTAWALGVLSCDETPRGRSRHMRAIAVLLGHDWWGKGTRSKPALLALGFADAPAIDALKTKVLNEFPPEAIGLYGRDPAWLEYAVLRHATTSGDLPPPSGSHASGGILGPATAYASGPPSCWRPEAPSTNTFVNPYVELTAHVSVTYGQADTAPNVDAQRWNDCGRFWSPPDPASPSQPLDGARFVAANWAPCKTPSPPFSCPPFECEQNPPGPGTDYDRHFLLEQFFVGLPIGNAHFENVLGIWAFKNRRIAADGSSVDAHRLSFHLASCGNDQVEGAMGGAIGKLPMKVVLDSGYIEVWSEGGRTHVASVKEAAFSDRAANWLTQLNPALKELNDQLGELACCLPH